MRLDKLLSDMNVGARSEIKKNIRKGQVSVNGETIKDAGISVSGDEEIVYLGQRIQYETFEYYMMNKPAGVISASEDTRQETVLDLMDTNRRKDLFPVGRLDKDTVGLLLISNDGQLAHELLSPKKHVDKRYFVKLTGRLTEDDVDKFSKGFRVDEEFTALPSKLEIKSAGDISEAEITIREGKFHQIKRMFQAVGKEVIYLKRLSMGSLVLDENLAEGEYRRLTDEEIRKLKNR